MGRRDLPDLYAQSPHPGTLKMKIKNHNHIDFLHLYKEC